MDMGRLRQIDAYLWTLPKAGGEQRHDIALYGSRELLASMDDKVLEQIANVAQLPGLIGAAEEAPGAYKDADLVAEATERAGLARRVALLRPKVCVKG